ncbi:Rne/Rng family ribonuclease, partial [Leucobacter sp. M11]|uniref:Rne/Rng family ribonuclease n=1 Tax=Leucobacter sp. M11 TaxID=2993565 RepID=UPI002D7F1240
PAAPVEVSEPTKPADSTEQVPAAEEDAPAAPAEATEPAAPENPLAAVLPSAPMTPEERFRASTRLIFLAPDLPPLPPRQQREPRGFDAYRDQPRDEEHDDREPASSRTRTRTRGRARAEDHDGPRDAARDRDRDRDRDAHDEGQRRQRSAPVITEPQKIKGSTRLEAKKQRRRDGREAGRRRVVVTESEFLARRESVDRMMLVRAKADRIQIGVMEDKVLVEHYVARSSETSLIGNVYLGRVQNVLPSMEAAFVDIGRGRNAVLYSGEVDWSALDGGNTARKIENVLKPGDHVLVQVTKDPVGHKGARLTSQVSLPGRFLVYVPGGSMNGISRKLPDTERARLKKILKEVLPDSAGVIVRTAAEGATEEQLTLDVQRLTRQWDSIQAKTKSGNAPALLHSEPDMLIKIVRDVFNEDFQKLVIAGEETHRTITDYLSQVAPDLIERVEAHTGERDLFDQFRVTEQIAKALDRKVWLPSGGSLVIDRTEAMTVVDVNTGKFVGSGGNLEETVTKNNLEAAEEIVRQLRLRDIGGIIVVDFIDMVLESNRDLVLRRMIECLSRDRTKHQVAEVTSLGLVQMTRKKLGLGLLESFSEACETCAGRGIIVHHDPVVKHRGEGQSASGQSGQSGQASGSSRKRRSGGGGGNASSPQAAPVTAPVQAHSISDGAKDMLAKVAAKTLSNGRENGTEDAAPAEQSPAPEAARESARPAAEPANAAPVDAAPVGDSEAAALLAVSELLGQPLPETAQPRRRGGRRSSAAASPADTDLLGSVLDALPDAPAPGQSRNRSRRVSTQAIRGGERPELTEN